MNRILALVAVIILLSTIHISAVSSCENETTTAKKYHCYRFVDEEDSIGDVYIIDMEQVLFIKYFKSTNKKYLYFKNGTKEAYHNSLGARLREYRNFLKDHPEYLR